MYFLAEFYLVYINPFRRMFTRTTLLVQMDYNIKKSAQTQNLKDMFSTQTNGQG